MLNRSAPELEFLSPQEFLAIGCPPNGGTGLTVMTTSGRELWEARGSGLTVWPRFIRSAGGSRFARETLVVSHHVQACSPNDSEDIKGQLVQILNVLDGQVVLETAASPALDAGGNVALSPSGRRAAVLNGGAILVFDLPAPPTVPSLVPNSLAH